MTPEEMNPRPATDEEIKNLKTNPAYNVFRIDPRKPTTQAAIDALLEGLLTD